MRVIQSLLIIVFVVASFSAMTITTQAASSGIVLEDVDVKYLNLKIIVLE